MSKTELEAAAKEILDLIDRDSGHPDERPMLKEWSAAFYGLRIAYNNIFSRVCENCGQPSGKAVYCCDKCYFEHSVKDIED